ncbi:unnamed protein product, partial [Iphiclides podalirius]
MVRHSPVGRRPGHARLAPPFHGYPMSKAAFRSAGKHLADNLGDFDVINVHRIVGDSARAAASDEKRRKLQKKEENTRTFRGPCVGAIPRRANDRPRIDINRTDTRPNYTADRVGSAPRYVTGSGRLEADSPPAITFNNLGLTTMRKKPHRARSQEVGNNDKKQTRRAGPN